MTGAKTQSLLIKKSEVKPLIRVLDSRFFFLLRVLDFHPQVFIDLAEGVVDVVEEFAAILNLLRRIQNVVVLVFLAHQLNRALVGAGVPDVFAVHLRDVGAAEEVDPLRY